MSEMYNPLIPFLVESLMIEGIYRDPTEEELVATAEFLDGQLCRNTVLILQSVYAPGMPVRKQSGMNVRVGQYIAPPGGHAILPALESVLKITDAYKCHVAFEILHPFMDGNGRTGRAVWLWLMKYNSDQPFALPFLHRFYYQTLANAR